MTKRYDCGGEMLTIREMAKRIGVNRETIWQRIHYRHMTPENAVMEDRMAKHYKVGGEMLTVAEMARRSGIDPNTIRVRMCHGDSPERAMRPLERRENKERYNVDGEMLTITEMARRSGVARSTIRRRIESGIEPKHAMRKMRFGCNDMMGIPTTGKEIEAAVGVSYSAIQARAQHFHTDIQTEIDIATIAAILRGKIERRPGWLPDRLKEESE